MKGRGRALFLAAAFVLLAAGGVFAARRATAEHDTLMRVGGAMNACTCTQRIEP